ncbi:pyocin knob domain-containing protein [Cribrihabitans pelagius]|uniref:pyocin knob domain-containing protein n=1 Tax=Cribrihabitans pelagius TaxID=1765746 RepID=UPI003B5B3A69
MAWVKSGTVAVTNGSPVVTGTGTGWFGSLQNGWAFVGPDGRTYEILTVDNATAITLATNYQGSTASGQVYAAMPTSSLAADLTAALQSLIVGFQAAKDLLDGGYFANALAAFNTDRDTGVELVGTNEIGLKAGDVLQLILKGGVATGAAVQSDGADATDGKLLKANAYGWGGKALTVPNDNLDDITVAGNYFLTTAVLAASTLPAGHGFSSGSCLIHFQFNADNSAQFLIAHGTGYAFTRIKDGGVWQPWALLYSNTSLLGTVSQSGGTPTGAVIERGNNASGEYVRFADGTQVCWSNGFTADSTAATGNVFAWANYQTWNFPAAFIVSPLVSVGGRSNALSCWGSAGGISASKADIGCMTTISQTARTVSAVAVGRWF